MTNRSTYAPGAANARGYRGRFAPSPTGPLHFGSLLAAVASYLEARRRDGAWLVRIEDIDPPREVAGAADQILRTLEGFGLHWDESVLYQSDRHEAYRAALARLQEAGLLYRCTCSRKHIAAAVRQRDAQDGRRRSADYYPGTCRGASGQSGRHGALRVLVPDQPIAFTDAVQGEQRQNLATEVGDFVVHRTDGLFAYQLAVVVDDAAQEISHVVRGSDLLLSTARQIHLQQVLGVPTPGYAHIPVAVNAAGQKLSKQTGAPALDPRQPGRALWQAFAFLGHRPPIELRDAPTATLWSWALEVWQLQRVPRLIAGPVEPLRP